jgi:hypothetical protein
MCRHPYRQCCESVIFLHGSGSGSADPYLYLKDPDPAPDPAFFVSDLQVFWLSTVRYFLKLHFHHFFKEKKC